MVAVAVLVVFGEVLHVMVDSRLTAEPFLVRVQDDTVLSRHVHTDAVVWKRFVGVEVEHKQILAALKHDHLVLLVLQRHVARIVGAQPSVLLFDVVHFFVPVVQEAVPLRAKERRLVTSEDERKIDFSKAKNCVPTSTVRRRPN